MRCWYLTLAVTFGLSTGDAMAQIGPLFGEKNHEGQIGHATNLLGGWTSDPVSGRPRPTASNPFWQSDPFTGNARPTANNPFWQSDPFTGNARPTANNPFWQSDPFTGNARPTLNNPYWQSDPFNRVRPNPIRRNGGLIIRGDGSFLIR
jgi:hypothetical protein